MADYIDQLVARGIVSPRAAERLIAGDNAGYLKETFTPSYLRDTPSSPEADRALADPNARPGKIGPPSGPPTAVQMGAGLAGDAASWLAPELKGGAALAGMAPAITPKMASRLMEMINGGSSRQQAADALGVGKATVNRYLAARDITTAQPSFWDANPDKLQRLKEMASQGHSQAKIAEELGTTPGNIYQKLKTMQGAGQFDYQAPERRVWKLPENQQRLKDLAAQGYSQSEIASVLKGGPAGKQQINRSSVSRELSAMRERGELPDYAPQFGGSAGKTPSMPQFKSLSGDVPADPEYEAAYEAYLFGEKR